jgi:AcrR family transcriptional regulator
MTLYRHFASKDELVAELSTPMGECGGRLLGPLRAGASRRGTPSPFAFDDAEHAALVAGDEDAAWVGGVMAAARKN